MFQKILIANRGEIAVRVIRACRALGVRSIAIYSEADADALHVRLADEAHPCGPARATESYLDIPGIVAIARRAGAEAIHPGYGFLSENADFAQAVVDAGIVFIGPSPEVIRAMGGKIAARESMRAAGVPVVPGVREAIRSVEQAHAAARELGYPVLVKASAGGGGRGMRRVNDEAELEAALERAASEALAAFGDDTIYLERYLSGPRHIEIQILADQQGNTLHLGERECSIQRRHQKLVEEAPAFGMSAAMRAEMGDAAVRAAQAVGYVGAGTCEFMLDSTGAFYFLEMNTRIQVEHPVTEAVTGLDLVALQIRIAAGEPIPFAQSEVALTGHAIEARIYAEDPDAGFVPSPGPILAWHAPDGPGVRLDAGFEAGQTVTPHYDAMLAKLIVNGRDREEALARLAEALDGFWIGGLRTGLPFLRRLATNAIFRAGAYDTGFIETELARAGSGLAAPREIDASTRALLLVAAAHQVVAGGDDDVSRRVRLQLPRRDPVMVAIEIEAEAGAAGVARAATVANAATPAATAVGGAAAQILPRSNRIRAVIEEADERSEVSVRMTAVLRAGTSGDGVAAARPDVVYDAELAGRMTRLTVVSKRSGEIEVGLRDQVVRVRVK